MRSRSILMFSAGVCVALLAACAPRQADPPAPTSEERLATLMAAPVEPEWIAPLSSVGSQAVRADGVVLVIAQGAGGTGATLRAVDAQTGEEVWSAPATSGASRVDAAWSPAVARTTDGTAVTLVVGSAERQPDGNWAHRLEVRSVATGEVLATPADTWVSNVQTCGDDICLSAWSPDGGWRDAELDADTGSIELGDDIGSGSVDAWQLTDDLRLGVDEDYLAWEVDDEEVWRATLSEHLPAGVAPSVFSGDFQLTVVVDDPSAPGIMAIDFTTTGDPATSATSATFAFSLEDGRPLWASTDISLCRSGEPVTCTVSAESVGASAAAAPQTYTGLDLATGEPTWSTTLDAVTQPVTDGSAPSAATPGYLPVTEGGDTVFLDSSTGEVVPAPEDAVFACFSDATWSGPEDARSSKPIVQYSSGMLATACDATGATDDLRLSRAAVLASAPAAWRGDDRRDSSVSLGRAVEDPLDDEPASYYIATAEGLAAYRF